MVQTEPPINVANFAERYAIADCQSLAACCAQDSLEFNHDACIGRAKQAETSSMEAALMRRVDFDEVMAADCLAALESISKSCNDLPNRELFSSCRLLFRGTLPIGAECGSSSECEGSQQGLAICDSTPTGWTCIAHEPHRRGTLGDPCGHTCSDWSCSTSDERSPTYCYIEDGLYCNPMTRLCDSPPPDVGAFCQDSCRTGAYCRDSQCVAQASDGSCADTPEACAQSAYCDVVTKQCQPRLQDGAACSSNASCLSGYCRDGACGSFRYASVKACSGNYEWYEL